MGNVYIYIFVMAAVTYLVRTLPLTLIRKEIKNPWIRSFLFYLPYVTLSVMTFPAIISGTATVWSGILGFLAALFLAWREESLLRVVLGTCLVVFIAELILIA